MNIALSNNSHGTIVEIKGYRDKLSEQRMLHTIHNLREYKNALIARRNKLPKHEREYYAQPLRWDQLGKTGSIFSVERGQVSMD